MKSNLKLIDKIYQLIEDSRVFGTLAFAHAARAGFVAIALLKSLIQNGSLSYNRMLEFQETIPTVASEFQIALSNKLSLNELIKKFGHLRPGTYDVNQKAYWENPDFYFLRRENFNKKNKSKFIFPKKELKRFSVYNKKT